MQEIFYTDMLKETIEQLKKGAFLTVKAEEQVNTMTIGWGMVGYIWAKPIFQVLVRESRHTFNLIEKSDNFTVSLPLNEDMKKELAFCGTKSGRDIDKFKELKLTQKPAQKLDTPIIGECTLHYECKIIAKQRLCPEQINEKERISCYQNNDYHTMYYGEIVAAYLI